jgi:hypothetical protein
MKKRNILLLIALLAALYAANAQKLTESQLFVRAELHDGIYAPQELFCEELTVGYHITGRKVIIISKQLELDLKVKKKRLGKYDSWKAVDKDKQYYYITPFQSEDVFGLYIQPTDKRLTLTYDRPVVIVATGNLCK